MKILVYLSLAIYFTFYVFEGPVRYFFNMIGADSLIFIRDIILITPLLLLIFLTQLVKKRLDPAFLIFALIIAVHGMVTMLNIKSGFVVLYSTKVLITALVGAVSAQYFMKPDKNIIMVTLMFWAVTFVSVFLDKYFVEFPWQGLETSIGDIKVDISRNWQITGENKRAAGLMRSSINTAIITPLLAFILIFNIRKLLPKLIVMFLTTLVLYWTTQKAAILAFVLTCVLSLLAYRWPVKLLKLGVSFAFLLMILLPIILPQFTMPHGEGGVFSMSSFYMRIEEVWPDAWMWIDRNQAFPFGVGLGGIGGAQRFYAVKDVNPADNMYIFLYAYFGVMSFVYMGWIWWKCISTNPKTSPDVAMAMSILLYLLLYGAALTIIEDQMGSFFLGAAVAWIAKNHVHRKEQKNKEIETNYHAI